MVFLIGIAIIALTTFVIGAVAVVAYVVSCSRLHLALRARTPPRNPQGSTSGDISMDELLCAIFDRRD